MLGTRATNDVMDDDIHGSSSSKVFLFIGQTERVIALTSFITPTHTGVSKQEEERRASELAASGERGDSIAGGGLFSNHSLITSSISCPAISVGVINQRGH